MSGETIEKELREQISIIGEAVSRVHAGIIMDIDAVEEQVAHICGKINAMPLNEARKLEPVMAEMIGKLEELAAALTDFQNRSRNRNNSEGEDDNDGTG